MLVNKVFLKLFAFPGGILIFVIIKYHDIKLERKVSLGWTKLVFFNIQGDFICHEPVTQFSEVLVYNFL